MSADRQPPDKKAEQFLKEEVKSARNGVGGFLIAGLAVCRTLQVFSRVPGTTGLYSQLAWLAGATIQGFYLFGHTEKYGRIDRISFESILTLQYLWWLVGVGIAVWSSRRRTANARLYPGRGIFFAHWMRDDFAGLGSDAVIGIGLIVLFRVFGCPTLANWYSVILGWTVLCHALLFGHELWIRLRIRAAKRRSAYWNKQVRGRHYV